MADTNKDTIYIDIDDEITTIIDKVTASSSKVVALVLPKRATTLQSIVNMKLLKRSADQGKKNLVLVTTESGLMPLAGAVGLHVAKTPNSRPEIPSAADSPDALSEEEAVSLMEDDEEPEPATAENAGDVAVGALAGAAGGAALANRPDNSVETIELDNEDIAPAASASAGAATAGKAAKKPKKNKKLAIPDFDRFKMLLIFGSLGVVLLIVLAYVMFAVLPKATINVKTNASNVNTNVDMTLSTSTTTLSTSSNTVPAKQASVQKTSTGTAPATGQKNNGDKASGTITITAKECGASALNDPSFPAGSGVTASGNVYVTQESAKFGSPNKQGNCFVYNSSAISIKAQNAGAKYNVNSGTSFTVSGHPDFTSVTGAANGGTDDIQTVVSQGDIDAAKAKATAEAGNTAQEELNDDLKSQNLYAITATYSAGTPAVTNSANVGDTAGAVTVTQTVTYTMMGVKENDLNTVIDNDIKGQIDTEKQGILTRGIEQNSFKLKSTTATGAVVNVQTVAEVGPSLDTGQLAKDAAGKKSSEIKSDIGSNPDVTDVTVKLSPFWVTKAPKNVDKITVKIAKPTNTANGN